MESGCAKKLPVRPVLLITLDSEDQAFTFNRPEYHSYALKSEVKDNIRKHLPKAGQGYLLFSNGYLYWWCCWPDQPWNPYDFGRVTFTGEW